MKITCVTGRVILSGLCLSAGLLAGCAGEPAGSVAAPAPVAVEKTAPAASAPARDWPAIIHKFAIQDGCQDAQADMRLSGRDNEGRSVQISFRVQRKYMADKTATLLVVTAPREETDKALLAIETPAGPTEAVSYLSGLKKLARFKSGTLRDFHGQKVYIQELLGMELNKYEVAGAEPASENGQALTRVSLTGKTGYELAFPRADIFVRDNAAGEIEPMRCEFFDAKGKLLRRVKINEVKKIQNYRTITSVEIEDVTNGRRVRLETTNVKYDQKPADNLFTEAHLTKLITDAGKKLIE
ncbi:MAG: outer membrane lipoprotein-sorting protein [Blastocatellia bacterium]